MLTTYNELIFCSINAMDSPVSIAVELAMLRVISCCALTGFVK
jgi:hypothetical protein